MYIPDEEMVAKSLLESLDGTFDVGYATPNNMSDSPSGCLVVTAIGGGVNPSNGVRTSVVQVESVAYDPNSPFPPWWLASTNAQFVVEKTSVAQQLGRTQIDLPEDYYNVHLLEAYVSSLPRKIPGDQGGYAIYVLELTVVWTPLLS